MKVLFVSSLPSFYTDENSSYMHRLIMLKKGLEKYGINTNILYLGNYLFRTPSLITPLNLPFIFKLMRGYDIIHGGGTGGAYVAGLAKYFLKLDNKIIYDIHGNAIEENRLLRRSLFDMTGNYRVFQTKIMESIATKYSDYFIACSEPLKDYYNSKGIDKDRIEVIPNGVDTELFKPKNVNDKENKNFIVTYAGGFHKYQGIDILIRAGELLQEEDDVKFRIIGFQKGDLHLKRSIDQRLGKKAELIDRLPRRDLVSYLNESDILVIPRLSCPALEAAFPTKFVEYISIGKPVIATRVGQIAKLVEEYNCGLVCEPTAESLADAIAKAKNLSHEELFKMGTNGRKLAVTKFDQDIIGKKYSKFLYEIMRHSIHPGSDIENGEFH
jgi:glycosyltransferase involved in cell wall biosynthesis